MNATNVVSGARERVTSYESCACAYEISHSRSPPYQSSIHRRRILWVHKQDGYVVWSSGRRNFVAYRSDIETILGKTACQDIDIGNFVNDHKALIRTANARANVDCAPSSTTEPHPPEAEAPSSSRSGSTQADVSSVAETSTISGLGVATSVCANDPSSVADAVPEYDESQQMRFKKSKSIWSAPERRDDDASAVVYHDVLQLMRDTNALRSKVLREKVLSYTRTNASSHRVVAFDIVVDSSASDARVERVTSVSGQRAITDVANGMSSSSYVEERRVIVVCAKSNGLVSLDTMTGAEREIRCVFGVDRPLTEETRDGMFLSDWVHFMYDEFGGCSARVTRLRAQKWRHALKRVVDRDAVAHEECDELRELANTLCFGRCRYSRRCELWKCARKFERFLDTVLATDGDSASIRLVFHGSTKEGYRGMRSVCEIVANSKGKNAYGHGTYYGLTPLDVAQFNDSNAYPPGSCAVSFLLLSEGVSGWNHTFDTCVRKGMEKYRTFSWQSEVVGKDNCIVVYDSSIVLTIGFLHAEIVSVPPATVPSTSK